MPDLEEGESIEVPGFSGVMYTIRHAGGVYSCSCPAWQTQLVPTTQRTCKHLRRLRGDAAEDARVGRFGPPSPRAAGHPQQSMPAEPATIRLPALRWTEAVVVEYDMTGDRFNGFRSRLGNGQMVPVIGGITDRVRDCPPPVGGIVTLQYQQVSVTGSPIAASYAGMRPNVAETLPPPESTS